jgi:8-oxo-dGTP pyrophosphatase MutT (NUDIX family)
VETRDTARLVVLDPQDRILLMRIPASDVSDPELWVTLGGRIEPGETVMQAASRELREETGIVDAQLGPVVWYGEQVLDVAGQPRHLRESFVLARCPSAATLSDTGWTPEEREVIAEMRWWSLAELDTSTRTVKPPKLAEHLRALLDEDPVAVAGPHGPRTIDLQ